MFHPRETYLARITRDCSYFAEFNTPLSGAVRMAGRDFALILSIAVVIVAARSPIKKCPRPAAFPECMFDGDKSLWCDMSNYESLNDISCNGIDLRRVTALYLNDSCLRDLNAGSRMRHFLNLTILKLDDNKLSEIPERVFTRNLNLQSMDLSTNVIKVIHRRAFKGLRKLRKLSIDDNNIFHLEKNWLQDLTGLRNLSMTKNEITKLLHGHFSSLRRLTALNLKDNQISVIEARTFNGLAELEELHLDGNLLTGIQTGTFNGLRSLRILTLSSNKISSWSLVRAPFPHHVPHNPNVMTSLLQDAFRALCNLEYVNLRSNNLTHLDANWLRVGGSHLINVDLSDNPWECRCDAVEFMRLLKTDESRMNVTDIICETPKYAKNRNLLDQPLIDEIEFRGDCKLDTSVSKTRMTPTRCDFATDDMLLQKPAFDSFVQKEDQVPESASPGAVALQNTKLPSFAGHRALVMQSTDRNGSVTSLRPLPFGYTLIFISVAFKLIAS